MPAAVPIIGEPKVNDWGLALTVECPECKTNTLLQGKAGAGVVCCNPKCDRAFQLVVFALDKNGKDLHVRLAMGIVPKIEAPSGLVTP